MSDDGKLDDCHACDWPVAPPIDNRPGLPELAYRAGTWATFLDGMKLELGRRAALDGLTTRAPDDPAIALLDAWAVVGDILTFYQERIANEGFLRTANDRRSVLELARAIGYELGAGVAASTYLGFQVDQPLVPGAGLPMPTTIAVTAGTKVLSVPGPNQQPQTFETIETIEARAAWNAMLPKTTQRQLLQVVAGKVERVDPSTGAGTVTEKLYFAGIATNLRVGDVIVVRVGTENHASTDAVFPATGVQCLYVTEVALDYNLKRTTVEVSQDGGAPPPFSMPPQAPGTVDLAPLPMTAANVRARIIEQDWTEGDLAAFLEVQRWDPDAVAAQVQTLLARDPKPAKIYALRTRCGTFGNNAPLWKTIDNAYAGSNQTNPWPKDWDASPRPSVWENSQGTTLGSADLYLDRVVQGVAKRGYIALVRGSSTKAPIAFRIKHVSETTRADYAISAKVTGLDLLEADDGTAIGMTQKQGIYAPFFVRNTTVHCQSEALDVAEAPIENDSVLAANSNAQITLDRLVFGLTEDQKVAWRGAVLDPTTLEPTGRVATEVLTVSAVNHCRGYTTITFQQALEHSYVRSSVVLCGNVATATHGTTTANEIIGSGDGSRVHQTFALKVAPLTYVSAATPTGSASTLSVRVADVEWTEVESLYPYGPNDRVFVSRQQPDGTTHVTFGDGIHGARLPTGRNNVKASYRTGTGAEGEMKAGRIQVLQTRPLGLGSGINLVDATGSESPERIADARVNAPRTVRTLDRLVSLYDFEDFARGFAGVGKAQSTPIWSGEQMRVHLTLGDTIGRPLDDDAIAAQNLVAAIAGASDGRHAVLVAGYRPRFFKLALEVIVDSAYEVKKVIQSVRSALRAAFAYHARELGQSVTEAEIVRIAHSRAGVIATDVNELYDAQDGAPSLSGVLQAFGAHYDETTAQVIPSDLLLLHPVGLTVIGSQP